ncbi:LuxR family transcriptional regulator [Burkholderia sp. LA-2-3-30-S1-D2]|uniref:LuxR family transcriptional regulator n=1 Tax=Burkholderia sp. LA-2-3-30-S1-D2 TaxID=1637862 RepID=UPI000A9C3BE1|nr:LuxR family transcriptional regulator [Burkholderia sp. LA-2-3-30-S1-D2]
MTFEGPANAPGNTIPWGKIDRKGNDMHAWKEKYLNGYAAAKSEADVFLELTADVRALGFEYCSFGLRIPFPVTNPQFMLQSNYPEPWVKRYVSQNYFAVDPTVRHGLSQLMPMIWRADTPTQSFEFWKEADHFGLRHGWCMPSVSRTGAIGLVTMVRSSEPIDECELEEKGYQMSWLANTANCAMSMHLLAQRAPEYAVELTARERESLQWSAAGKTYVEIGKIMHVDERTVKFHLVNAMRKLNASNKTEAAVKATILGLLF